MKKRMILSSITTLLITSMVMTGTSKNVYALTDFQKNFIDSIKEAALEGYETNHILPSLTIAQAI